MRTGPISNGMLLQMQQEQRTAVISGLSQNVRRRLANIASLGAEREIQKASEQVDAGHRAWAIPSSGTAWISAGSPPS